MSRRAKSIVLITIVLIVLIGFIYDYVQVSSAINKLEITDISIGSVNFQGSPIPTKIDMDILLKIRNPTSYTIIIDKIKYDIYINGELVAQGSKHDVAIYANSDTTLSIPLSVSAVGTVKSLFESLKEGVATVEVKGFVEAPIRWFGIIRTFTINVPYSTSETIKLNLPSFFPVETPVKVISAKFEPSTITEGEKVNVVVELQCDKELAYNIKVVIKKDIAYGFDEIAYTYTTTVKFPGRKVIEFTWTPPEPSHGRLRGYHIEVYADDHKIYSMPSEYPPRLKVLEKPKGSVQVIEAYWVENGQRITTAYVGDKVDACVKIMGVNAPVSGKLRIVVRKDRAGLPDVDYASKTFYVSISPGEVRTYCVSFIPDQASSFTMRGYHIEVWFNNAKVYSMPSEYPPRLRVIEQSPTTTQPAVGELSIVDVYWLVNGIKSYTAHVGANVKGCIVVLAKGGRVEASIKIQIKKDLAFRPDEILMEKQFTIVLSPGEEKVLCISFISQERSSMLFRGYFIEVFVDGKKVYSMPSEYPPRLKVS